MHRGRGRVSRSTPAQRGANVSPRSDVDARQRPQRQLRPPTRYAEVVPQATQQRSCSARHKSREELQQATDDFIRNMRVEHERQCEQQQHREVGSEENDIEDMEVVEGTSNEQGEEQDETMENRREGQENVSSEHSQPTEEGQTGNFILLLQQQMHKQQQQHQQQMQLQQRQMELLLETVLNRSTTTTTENPVKSRLGVYDGSTDYLVYKTQFENAAVKANWSEEDKCFHLSQQLRGEGTKVYASLLRRGVSITYQKLDETLSKQFSKHISSAQARSVLMAIKQGPEQSMTDFARELEQAGRAYFVDVPEKFIQENLFELFVKGLRDQECQLFCKYAQTETLDAALELVTTSSAIDIPTAKKVRLTDVSSERESRETQERIASVRQM